MKAPHRKLRHYSDMLERLTMALKAGFHLETSWYAYAILEDRLISILHASGGAVDKNGRLFRNFGYKLKIADARRKHDALLRVYFPDTWITELTTWKNQRNDLMHAMASAAVPLVDLDIQAQTLATAGERLAFDACRRVRLLKRNRGKVAIPAHPFPY